MKFKFSKEAQSVIDSIASLPEEVVNSEDLRKPFEIIKNFDRQLKDNKTKNKFWAKQRRELSYFFQIWHDVECSIKDDSKKGYSKIVNIFKNIQNGKKLKHVSHVRLALNYGILYLSDMEIQELINRNKID